MDDIDTDITAITITVASLAKKEGKVCCEMSDDLAKIVILHEEVEGWRKPASMPAANAAARATPQWRCSPQVGFFSHKKSLQIYFYGS